MHAWSISVGDTTYQVVNPMGWSTYYSRKYSATAILLGYIAKAIANPTALQQAYQPAMLISERCSKASIGIFESLSEPISPVSPHVFRGSSALVVIKGVVQVMKPGDRIGREYTGARENL